MRIVMLTGLITAFILPGTENPYSIEENFKFSSGLSLYDNMYQLAIREIEENIITIDSGTIRFMAGAHWPGLWTRDIAYSIQLGIGLIYPKISENSLILSIENVKGIGKVWRQDSCGHFGGWPNLTDAIVGATGAWALYKFTGDRDLLELSYKITFSSLKRTERDAYDEHTGLFKGCASFMESNSAYPKKYSNDGKAVGSTKVLSTNLLYYNSYKLAVEMGRLIGIQEKELSELKQKANDLRNTIRNRLWLPSKGYYSYFEDADGKLTDRMEGLWESLL